MLGVGWTCFFPVSWGPVPLRITAVDILGATEGPYQTQFSRGGGQVEQNLVHQQSGEPDRAGKICLVVPAMPPNVPSEP